jgi:hypothetical protein
MRLHCMLDVHAGLRAELARYRIYTRSLANVTLSNADMSLSMVILMSDMFLGPESVIFGDHASNMALSDTWRVFGHIRHAEEIQS